MSKIIFSENAAVNDARLGKLYAPLKMYIQQESDAHTKSKDYENILYKTETSDSWAEAFVTADSFGEWGDRSEGGTSAVDSFGETHKKIIEHSESGKAFAITKKMRDDLSSRSLPLKSKEVAKKFIDSYHMTRNKKMVQALVQGGKAVGDLINGRFIKVAGHLIDVTTGDDQPLFSKSHKAGKESLHGEFIQSNYFYTTDKAVLDQTTGSGALSLLLDKLSVIGRNMKDENGEPMGYTYDTVVIPGDNALLEQLMRRALGSANMPGTQLNDISTQYGIKNLLILPEWTTTGTQNPHQFMLQSSKAKDELNGSVFLERVPLDLRNWVDNATRNWVWDGYARYGVGFPTYKHILRMVIDDAGTMAEVATDLATV